jgi:hypothetical protein
MAENNEKMKKAEEHLTNALADVAESEPGGKRPGMTGPGPNRRWRRRAAPRTKIRIEQIGSSRRL